MRNVEKVKHRQNGTNNPNLRLYIVIDFKDKQAFAACSMDSHHSSHLRQLNHGMAPTLLQPGRTWAALWGPENTLPLSFTLTWTAWHNNLWIRKYLMKLIRVGEITSWLYDQFYYHCLFMLLWPEHWTVISDQCKKWGALIRSFILLWEGMVNQNIFDRFFILYLPLTLLQCTMCSS